MVRVVPFVLLLIKEKPVIKRIYLKQAGKRVWTLIMAIKKTLLFKDSAFLLFK